MRKLMVRALIGCLALILLLIAGDLLFFSQRFPFEWEPKVPPAQISRSAPNREGLITAARPLVTQIAPGEPLDVAIHWQRPDDAMAFDDKFFYAKNSERKFLPLATMNTLVFSLTAPDGTVSQAAAKLLTGPGDQSTRFSEMPGLVLRIDIDGLDLVAPKPSLAWRYHSAWRNQQSLQFIEAGTYKLSISGRIVCLHMPLVAFESRPIEFEVLPGIKTNAQLRTRASYVIATRLLPTTIPENDIVADDEDGNRHLAFYTGGIGKDNRWRSGFVFRPDGALLHAKPRILRGCVAAGTLIATQRGEIPIENVQRGDQVVSFDPNSKQLSTSTVCNARRQVATSAIQIRDSLCTTADHPIWANGAWKRADEVERGDVLVTTSSTIQVASISHVTGPVSVIDLDVSEPHNYFAGGVLVHNKEIKQPPRHRDWWYKLPGVPAPPPE